MCGFLNAAAVNIIATFSVGAHVRLQNVSRVWESTNFFRVKNAARFHVRLSIVGKYLALELMHGMDGDEMINHAVVFHHFRSNIIQ